MLPIIIAAWRMLPKYLVRVPAIMGNTRAMRRDDERLIWAEAFGWIDRTVGVAPTTEPLFCIASRSKVIAAMILVDRGVIELDAPLVRYVIVGAVDDGAYLLLYGVPATTITLKVQP